MEFLEVITSFLAGAGVGLLNFWIGYRIGERKGFTLKKYSDDTKQERK